MKGNADSSARGRPGALAALALAALALAGCSSSGSSVPPVASLGTTSAPGTSTSADPGTSRLGDRHRSGTGSGTEQRERHDRGQRDPVAEPVGGLRAQPR